MSVIRALHSLKTTGHDILKNNERPPLRAQLVQRLLKAEDWSGHTRDLALSVGRRNDNHLSCTRDARVRSFRSTYFSLPFNHCRSSFSNKRSLEAYISRVATLPEDRAQRLDRYGVRLDGGRFVLGVEKHRHAAEGTVTVNGRIIQSYRRKAGVTVM